MSSSFSLNLTSSIKPATTNGVKTQTTVTPPPSSEDNSKSIPSTTPLPPSATKSNSNEATWTSWKSSKLPPSTATTTASTEVGTRKHPTYRPLPSAPQDVLKKIRDAPIQEDSIEASTHFLSDEAEGGFASLGVHPSLVAHLTSAEKGGLGLKRPTKVQSRLIPELLAGKDAVVKSETGSGKTLSYLLPMLTQMAQTKGSSRSDGISAVILSPTRELCVQILEVLSSASRPFPWIISSAVVGGEKRKSEKARIRCVGGGGLGS